MLAQARRHGQIVSTLRVRHVVVPVNKMDMVGWDVATFNSIIADFQALAADFRFASIQTISLSALSGDNAAFRCGQAAWYSGPTLLDYLETVDVSSAGQQFTQMEKLSRTHYV